jgi:3-deoxy-manno-octulosonate cytidylyltransferase (CMP-KDO synthetase)
VKILGIIPARYASSRFPGKPLVEIGGKTMIQRVYLQCMQATKLSEVAVATDDTRIADHVRSFGGRVILTSEFHQTGTDRCAEALFLMKEGDSYDYIVNIQGDEPFISPELIDNLCDTLDYKTEIATAVKRITNPEALDDPNVVKVVLTMRKQALYFSRQAIPFVRDVPKADWLGKAEFYKHIGIYAYRNDVLKQIVKLPVNVLEQTEKLEQLRWLGYGYKIVACETSHDSIGVDTPEDLKNLKIEESGQ